MSILGDKNPLSIYITMVIYYLFVKVWYNNVDISSCKDHLNCYCLIIALYIHSNSHENYSMLVYKWYRGLQNELTKSVYRGLQNELAKSVYRGLQNELTKSVYRGLENENELTKSVYRGLQNELTKSVPLGWYSDTSILPFLKKNPSLNCIIPGLCKKKTILVLLC